MPPKKKQWFTKVKASKHKTKEEVLYGPLGYVETPARHAASSKVTPSTTSTASNPSTGISVASSLTMVTPQAPRAAAITASKNASTMSALDALPSPEVLCAQDLLEC